MIGGLLRTREALLKTGIRGFDELIGGGLPLGDYLLVGPPKIGKKLFVNQISYNVASRGEPVIYITMDRAPKRIREEMAHFKWLVEPLEEKNSFRFIDGFTMWYFYDIEYKKEEFFLDSLKNPSKIQAVVKGAREKVGFGGLAVFSSLSTYIQHVGFEKAFTLLSHLRAATEQIRNTSIGILTIGMHTEKELTALKHIFDGIIEMNFQKSDDKITRIIRVIGLGKKLDTFGWVEFHINDEGIVLDL
ncbi:MAG: RAD55 family ATPase [Candidatus Lokiarchaeia archaeon]